MRNNLKPVETASLVVKVTDVSKLARRVGFVKHAKPSVKKRIYVESVGSQSSGLVERRIRNYLARGSVD